MIEIKNLTISYKNNNGTFDAPAVQDVSFTIQDNETSCLIGESGSGKSTIMSAILGLLPLGTKIEGQILLDGVNLLTYDEEKFLSIRGKKISLIPQASLNSFTPVFTLGKILEELVTLHSKEKLTKEEIKNTICTTLADCGLSSEFLPKYPHEMSGGERQRAAIAAALVTGCRVLLADEPTTALDVVTQDKILQLLKRLQKEKNLTILLVTHDLAVASSLATNFFVMEHGHLIESTTRDKIFVAPQAKHTKELVEAANFYRNNFAQSGNTEKNQETESKWDKLTKWIKLIKKSLNVKI